MKFANLIVDGELVVGLETERGHLNLQKASEKYLVTIPKTIEEIIRGNYLETIQSLVDSAMADETLYIQPEEIVYAPILTQPEKILCVGLNYQKHVEESNIGDTPSEPVLFSKFNNALAAHQEVIPLPEIGTQFDYEVELVVVIGKEAKNVPAEEALDYVFGYTIGNDLSIRDLQFLSGQWLIGKTTDKFAPVGPYLVTADGINPQDLNISLKRNGVVVQKGHTSEMIFDVAEIVRYASERMTLRAGDLIFTGTPDGVVMGLPEAERDWLKSGDVLESTIENIGTLVNRLD